MWDAKIKEIHADANVNGNTGNVDVCVALDINTRQKYKLSATLMRTKHNGEPVLVTSSQTRTLLVMEDQTSLNFSFTVENPLPWDNADDSNQNLYELSCSLKPAGLMTGGAAALAINKIEPVDTAKAEIRFISNT